MGKCILFGSLVKYLDKCCKVGKHQSAKRPNGLRGRSCGLCPNYRGHRGETWDKKVLVVTDLGD